MIAKAEKAASHNYAVQNGRGLFKAISKIVGNLVLIPSQDSANDFL